MTISDLQNNTQKKNKDESLSTKTLNPASILFRFTTLGDLCFIGELSMDYIISYSIR